MKRQLRVAVLTILVLGGAAVLAAAQRADLRPAPVPSPLGKAVAAAVGDHRTRIASLEEELRKAPDEKEILAVQKEIEAEKERLETELLKIQRDRKQR